MCGIAGVVGLAAAEGEALVARMIETLVHRGPDDSGIWSGDGVAFGMRRLSVIDIEGGHQPMLTDDGVGLVFNGEIYNHEPVRREMMSQGHVFRTRSDTEVVLKRLAEQGPTGIEALAGMFAICLHDPRRNRLHLYRDRLGKKPLYYVSAAGRFLFASEPKALRAALGAWPSLDREAIGHYLTLRYLPGELTPWQGIRKLPPGSRLELDIETGKVAIHRFWSIAVHGTPLEPGRDPEAEFAMLFGNAVEQRLVAADVPVGVLLSGGLDSSAVSATAVERGHRAFHTFSVAFAGEDGGFDESRYARMVAAHIGSRHHEVTVDQGTFLETLPAVAAAMDEPLADLAAVPLWHVCRLARQDVTVVLSGEGSDEILAGYELEQLAARLERLRHLDRLPVGLLRACSRLAPGRLGTMLGALGEGGWPGYLRARAAHVTDHWSDGDKRLLMPDLQESTTDLIRSWYAAAPSSHPLEQMLQVMSGSWLVDDLLAKADRMSMAHSLELRTPFLDHRLVEWAARLPLLWKVGDRQSGWRSKRVLRDYCRARLPAAVIDRPKQGFPVPAYRWLERDHPRSLAGWAEDRLFNPASALDDLIERGPTRQALDAACRGDVAAQHRIWVLLILGFWRETQR